MSSELLTIEREIVLALGRYARACDDRDWAAFDTVFAPDVSANYAGIFVLEGRAAIVENVQSHLGGCGPSQHMMSNFEITAAGKSAESRCYIRAFHRGLGDKSDITYEVMGEYGARWRRFPEGWRAVEWTMKVFSELGSQAILGPLPE